MKLAITKASDIRKPLKGLRLFVSIPSEKPLKLPDCYIRITVTQLQNNIATLLMTYREVVIEIDNTTIQGSGYIESVTTKARTNG